MSKWVEIRDSVEEALKAKEVGQDMKLKFTNWLADEGTRMLEKAADNIVEECKSDASSEKGWCKVRDAVVIPATLNIGLTVLKVVLDKAAAEKL